MKKNLSLTLALLLALCLLLTACGGGDADVSGKVTPNQDSPAAAPTGEVVQSQDPTEPVASAPENELSLGRMEGGIYTNTYAGFACKLDSSWSFLSAKELEQIPSTVSDMVSGSELGDALADVQQFTDMMAENANDLTNINVLYQKLSMQERLAYAVLSEEQIIDATLEQSAAMLEAYTQAGITVTSMEKVTVNFAGRERFALHTTADVQGIPYYILQLFDFKLGEYGITTTLASFMDDKTGDLVELFSAVE